jgi:D-alanyl-D-alanine carboxypeptidase
VASVSRHMVAIIILPLAILAVVLSAGASGERIPAASDWNGKYAAVDAYIRRYAARNDLPGLAVTILDHGSIHHQFFGSATISPPSLVDERTSFEIGSLTKQFTAASVLLLVRSGRLDLDHKIAEYMRDAPHGDQITIRELLTHTSGLPEYLNSAIMVNRTGKPYDVSPIDILAFTANRPLEFAPGTRFEYSNTNYVLLGQIIANVSKLSYREYVERNIVKPLRLGSTFYTITEDGPNQAAGYSKSPAGLEKSSLIGFEWLSAAGAMSSSADDMITWDNALLENRLLTKREFIEMTTSGRLSSGRKTDYGFAWELSDKYGADTLSHSGAIPGFRSLNVLVPSKGLAIVALSNCDCFDAEAFVDTVLDMLENPSEVR